jgi:hypothetical protein
MRACEVTGPEKQAKKSMSDDGRVFRAGQSAAGGWMRFPDRLAALAPNTKNGGFRAGFAGRRQRRN